MTDSGSFFAERLEGVQTGDNKDIALLIGQFCEVDAVLLGSSERGRRSAVGPIELSRRWLIVSEPSATASIHLSIQV